MANAPHPTIRPLPRSDSHELSPGVGPTLLPSGNHERDAVDIGELWSTLRDHRGWILACGVFALAVFLTYTAVSRMTFKATGSLYLGELEQKAGGAAVSQALDFMGAPPGELGTEVEIIKSEALVSRAVLESGLNVYIMPPNYRPMRYWQWRLGKRNHHELERTAKEIGATQTMLAEGVREPRGFHVRFVSGPEYVLTGEGIPPTKGLLGEELELRDLKLTLTRGTESAPRPGSEYDLVVSPLDDAIGGAFAALDVTAPKAGSGGGSINVVRLEFLDTSPSRARAFLDRLMRGYLDQRQGWKTEEASAAENFVTNQLRGMRESLENAEKELADYKKKSGAVVLDEEARAMVEQIGNFEEQRVAVRLQVSALRDIQRVLSKSDTAPVEAYLLGEAQDSVLNGLGSSLTQAQEELKMMEQRFTDDAPPVREKRAEVKAQLDMVRNYVSTRLARAQEQLGSLDRVVGQFETKLKTVPHAALDLAQLMRRADVFSKMYSYLLERQQQAAIVKAATISNNRILDLPKMPYREDSPRLGLGVLASTLVGLLLGVVAVFAKQRLAATFQTVAEVRSRIAGVPVFSVIPRRFKKRERRAPWQSELPAVDLLAVEPRSAFTEAFRLLRANLYRSGPQKDNQVLLVTSPNAGDGKTTTVLALAAMLSADNNRVLVVDGDLHAPSHHQLLGLAQQPGLSDVLLGDRHWRDVVRTVSLSVGDFDTITSGEVCHSATECFASLQAAGFFNEVRAAYDYILIDSPSFPLVSDPLVMSMYADRIISVMRLRNTRRTLAEEHVARLCSLTQGALVINDDEVSPHHRYGYRPVNKKAQRETEQRRLKQVRQVPGTA